MLRYFFTPGIIAQYLFMYIITNHIRYCENHQSGIPALENCPTVLPRYPLPACICSI